MKCTPKVRRKLTERGALCYVEVFGRTKVRNRIEENHTFNEVSKKYGITKNQIQNG